MTTVFYEWKNTLTLLKKDTLVLVLYSWYKLTIDVYKNLLLYFWWLVLPFFVLAISNTNDIVLDSLSALLGYIVFLLARPTLEKKNTQYVIKKGFGYLGSFMLTSVIYHASLVVWAFLIMTVSMLWLPFNTLILFTVFFSTLSMLTKTLFFVKIWTIFFLLDSKGRFTDCLKATWHGYKMGLLNMPISMLLVFCIILATYISTFFYSSIPLYLQRPLYATIYPIIITLISVMYIKRVHDQCDLYFGRGINR